MVVSSNAKLLEQKRHDDDIADRCLKKQLYNLYKIIIIITVRGKQW